MFSVLHYKHAQGLNHSKKKKNELKMMTLCAPKNACAKPQCYFSLAISSLILHTHTLCASDPCSPIFTAFLSTEHDRKTPLTKPPQHTVTNTGERIQQRDQELGALNWPQTDLQCRRKAKGSLFFPDTPRACFFPGGLCRHPPPHCTCTAPLPHACTALKGPASCESLSASQHSIPTHLLSYGLSNL